MEQIIIIGFSGTPLYSPINKHKEWPFNLVRMYVGLEDADVLIEDLSRALEKV